MIKHKRLVAYNYYNHNTKYTYNNDSIRLSVRVPVSQVLNHKIDKEFQYNAEVG